MTQKLSLASTSTARIALLSRLGIDFESIPPNATEENLASETSREKSQRLATLKATSITPQNKNHWILGSDQVAEVNSHILSKPKTTERAFKQIKECLGQWVHFYTSITMTNGISTFEKTVEFSVKFRNDLSDEQIRDYIQRDDPLMCAGSFKAESLGIALFDNMNGSDISSLVGLPLIETRKLLERAGFNVLGSK